MKKQTETFTMDELTPFVRAADRLGVSLSALRKMEERGQIRFVRRAYGRPRVYVPNVDIDKLLEPLSVQQ